MDIDWVIVEGHEQKRPLSGIPSAVEMVLKLLHKVEPAYYELQSSWIDDKNGLQDFHERKIAGVEFHNPSFGEKGSGFQMDRLFGAIDEELGNGRCVIMPWPACVFMANKGFCLTWFPTWIIYTKRENEYLAFAKDTASIMRGERNKTLRSEKEFANTPTMFADFVRYIEGVDILTYKVKQ